MSAREYDVHTAPCLEGHVAWCLQRRAWAFDVSRERAAGRVICATLVATLPAVRRLAARFRVTHRGAFGGPKDSC